MTLQELAIKITIDDKASSEIDGISTGAITKANLMAKAFEGVVSAVGKAASAVYDFFKSAVGAYSEYEQLVGGAETLFKGAADEVVEDAKNAYETAGISANQYLQQVNSFAAGLVESIAKARVGINNTAQDIKKNTTELKRANQDAVTAESRRLSDMLEETRRALQDEYDARAQTYADEEDALRKSQAEEIEAFKAGVDFKVQLMVDEYNAKVKLIDDELAARLAAIDAELAALDREDKAQDEATKKRERRRKLDALQEALQYAGSIDERMAAQDALNKYLEKIRDEDAKSSRKTRREQLQQERKDAIDEANKKKDDLKAQYDQQIKAFQEQQAILLKQLQESQAKQLDEMQRAHKDALKELQRANSDQIKEIQRGNEDALRELRNRNTDQEAANKESLQSSEEYVQKTREDYHEAARLSKMAVVDMADNANKMGTDLSRLQDAYQGFNRGEFRMLDNLKLGYGGTKGEMQELLEYAEELAAQQGETADYSIDSFADIIEAIHRVQGELGASGYEYDVLKQKIEDQTLSERELRRVAEDLFLSEKNGYKDVEEAVADVTKRYKDGTLEVDEALILAGTTSYEASQTIQGAWNAAKGAWENWLIALADPNGDAEAATTNLIDKISIVAALLIPRVAQVLEGVKKEVIEKAPEIWATFKEEVLSLIPDEAKEKFKSFIDFLTGTAEEIQGVINFFDGVRKVVEPIAKLFEEIGKAIGSVSGSIANFFGGGYQQEVEAAARADASTEKLRTLLRQIGEEAGDKLDEGFREKVENGDLATLSSLAAQVRNNPELKDAMEAAASSAEYSFQSQIKDSFESGTNEYISSGLPSEIQSAAGKNLNASLLADNGKSVSDGFVDNAEWQWDERKGFFENIGGWIKANKGPVEEDYKLLQSAGEAIINGFTDSADAAWGNNRHVFSDISTLIGSFFNGAGTLLSGKGGSIIGGLSSGAQAKWAEVQRWFNGVPDNAFVAIGDVTATLSGRGRDILEGFRSGATSAWENASRWFDSIPDNVTNVIGDVANTLAGKGNDIIGGLRDGAQGMWSSVQGWFSQLPNSISNSIGNTAWTLYDAGRSIMDGLRSGLESAWSGIQSWVSGLGSWISQHKGPREYDLKLLIPNGQWIMQSLETGMRSAFPLIERTVGDISDMMAIDQQLSFGGMSNMQRQGVKALPPINVYLDYNAGEDATQLVNDMTSQMALYGYTMGVRRYA